VKPEKHSLQTIGVKDTAEACIAAADRKVKFLSLPSIMHAFGALTWNTPGMFDGFIVKRSSL